MGDGGIALVTPPSPGCAILRAEEGSREVVRVASWGGLVVGQLVASSVAPR
jgi:hypothetical protein